MKTTWVPGWVLNSSLAIAFALCGCSSDDPSDEVDDSSNAGDTADDGGGAGAGADDGADDADADGDSSAPGDDGSGESGGSDDDDGDGEDDDAGDGGAPTDCPPTPERMMFFGDSIFGCVGGISEQLRGPDWPGCSARIAWEWVNNNVNQLEYENYAVGGAVTNQVPDFQFNNITPGTAGHALVVIFVGGNDIVKYVSMSDDQAQASFLNDIEVLQSHWMRMFEFLENPANFPDGVTVLMHTQYNPFDDCVGPAGNFGFGQGLSEVTTGLLQQYNAKLTEWAQASPNRFIADPYSVFLGHGHHFDSPECPYYEPGTEYWMSDTIHPTTTGHAALSEEMIRALDRMYICE